MYQEAVLVTELESIYQEGFVDQWSNAPGIEPHHAALTDVAQYAAEKMAEHMIELVEAMESQPIHRIIQQLNEIHGLQIEPERAIPAAA